ncbi:glycosyltransferase [Pseudomonas sp.]|uniref:glycosyltransferase n=1 Tax=Pseudomonas sp. TaxID=306 RepID=UPI00299D8AF4|nr:glycosyltransferase [Pseudomonas sp.]MDX1366006.1 glycosyltransferase [Pseudomonas sp.]
MSELPQAVSSPVVSVLMPVFNGEKYLAKAMSSILSQTFRDFELLVLDDGSADDSLKILREFEVLDSRIRLTTRENRGLIATLNELVVQARGKYMARMDTDDIALPGRFARQLDFLEKNPSVVCVGGSFDIIDGAGRYLTTLKQPQLNAEIQKLMLVGHVAINHPTVMVRSATMRAVGGYDARYEAAEDYDLWLRIGEIGELANLSEVVLKYRLHENSVSETAGKKQRESIHRACECAWVRRGIASGVFAANGLWRPSSDVESQQTFALQYGWWAWNSCQRSTAIYYGWKSVKLQLFSLAGWKLLMIALIKPLPESRKEIR